jgi:hypothetical protein
MRVAGIAFLAWLAAGVLLFLGAGFALYCRAR